MGACNGSPVDEVINIEVSISTVISALLLKKSDS